MRNTREITELALLSFLDLKAVETIIQGMTVMADARGDRFLLDQAALGILTISVLGSFYLAYERINDIHLNNAFRE